MVTQRSEMEERWRRERERWSEMRERSESRGGDRREGRREMRRDYERDGETRRKGRLRKINQKEAWNTIEELAQYEEEEWDDPIFLNKGSFDYGNATFEGLVINFILDQEERVRQLEGYIGIVKEDFMKLFLEVIEKLKEETRMKECNSNQIQKIQKITKYPDTKGLDSRKANMFPELLTQKESSHAQGIFSSKPLYVGYARVILPNPPILRKSAFGFKPGAKRERNTKASTCRNSPRLIGGKIGMGIALQNALTVKDEHRIL
ncbi:hypothetical protein Tco_1569155 [Tanacetum coccineum]